MCATQRKRIAHYISFLYCILKIAVQRFDSHVQNSDFSQTTKFMKKIGLCGLVKSREATVICNCDNQLLFQNGTFL